MILELRGGKSCGPNATPPAVSVLLPGHFCFYTILWTSSSRSKGLLIEQGLHSCGEGGDFREAGFRRSTFLMQPKQNTSENGIADEERVPSSIYDKRSRRQSA
jgi:hypothetical protein